VKYWRLTAHNTSYGSGIDRRPHRRSRFVGQIEAHFHHVGDAGQPDGAVASEQLCVERSKHLRRVLRFDELAIASSARRFGRNP
jgi:hypothetical protein